MRDAFLKTGPVQIIKDKMKNGKRYFFLNVNLRPLLVHEIFRSRCQRLYRILQSVYCQFVHREYLADGVNSVMPPEIPVGRVKPDRMREMIADPGKPFETRFVIG